MKRDDPDGVTLSRRRTRVVLVAATALVSLAGLAVEILKSIYRWKGRSGVVPLLSLSHEQNVPTYFTAVLLLLASASSAWLAASTPPAPNQRPRIDVFAWWGLSAGFLYISIDEVIEIHERWGLGTGLGGALHFDWVIPAAALLVLLAVPYVPFLLRMPRGPRLRLILAGAIYVTGAVALELPLGWWAEEKGEKTLGYALIDWTEETLEMTGIVLYLFTAFDLLASRGARLRFGASPTEHSPPPPAPTAALEAAVEPSRDSP